MTPKQVKFIKAKAQGKSNREAAIEATGLTNIGSADTEAQRMLKNAQVSSALEIALAEAGFTTKAGAEALVDALKATKTATFKGEVYDSDIPDHAVRSSSARTIFSYLGYGSNAGGEGTTVNFNFGSDVHVRNS